MGINASGKNNFVFRFKTYMYFDSGPLLNLPVGYEVKNKDIYCRVISAQKRQTYVRKFIQ